MSSSNSNDVTLLDVGTSVGSPIENHSVQKHTFENQRGVEGATNCIDIPSNTNHNVIMEEAKTWISEIETIRDEVHLLSVRNAVLLDSLAMAGECAGS